VAVARRPAAGPGPSLGPLFINPGGPGGSGVEIAKFANRLFSAELLARFDIIGVDPRGVGGSTPVRCSGSVYPPGYTLFPRTETEFQQMLQHNRAIGLSCLRGTGRLLGHLDTVSAARDHEAVREALGTPELSWLGLSYGTLLGATYAELYPRRVRAMVLDAALDHSLTMVPMLADGITAVEDELVRFAGWCDVTPACALHGEPVLKIFDQIVVHADQHPAGAPGASRPVSGEDVRLNVMQLLLFKVPNAFGGGWPAAAEAIAAARDGDLSAFASPAQSGPTDPIYPALAIACMDYDPQVREFADMQMRMELGRQLAPHLQGASEAWTIMGCAGWPIRPANPPQRLHVHGTPPILIVNATHDASTPYVWAHGLAAQIDGSVLLTREGDGHTSSLTSPCAREHVDRYLLAGETPPAGQNCTD
jgi:pimeloyl-ACP methyl ester carboxylesterase